PVGIILLYPCVYAKVVLETCIRASTQLRAGRLVDNKIFTKDERGVVHWAGLLAFIMVFVLVLCTWFWWPSGKPVQGISLMIPLVCALYATAQAVSFRRRDSTRKAWWIYLILGAVLLVVLYQSFSTSVLISSPLSYPSMGDEGVSSAFQADL